MKKNRQLFLQCMKISFVQIVLSLAFVSISWANEASAQDLLNRRMSIEVTNEKVKTVLANIEKTAKIKFSYSPQVIQSNRRISFSSQNETLEEVLSKLLPPLQISYQVVGNQIILKQAPKKTGFADNPNGNETGLEVNSEMPLEQNVSGKVIDETGGALVGVSILIKGTQKGTVTNQDGDYTINVPDPQTVLVFSFVGYQPEEVVVGTRTKIDLTLKIDDKTLNEIVVVGYGTVKKNDLTGAVATVPVEEMKKIAVTSLDQALQGRASGVQITQNSGAPGGSTTIRIRGGNSIQGDNEPLYVIDGIPFKNDGAGSGSSFNVLSTLNPSDIETMSVLKDASSTAIYGSRGANGVVIITTKRGKAGKSTINFESYYGVQEVRKYYSVLNARE